MSGLIILSELSLAPGPKCQSRGHLLSLLSRRHPLWPLPLHPLNGWQRPYLRRLRLCLQILPLRPRASPQVSTSSYFRLVCLACPDVQLSDGGSRWPLSWPLWGTESASPPNSTIPVCCNQSKSVTQKSSPFLFPLKPFLLFSFDLSFFFLCSLK